ncbi:isocitrate lyase/PEP mutase family protein [Streptantibioticus cattleyicolor]|uniref:Carboxyvinyl-carboxyphosphonate phosphorylmutase n=1 Tax=Streptantibioticus cattleyicolor (strain ATCC 35852 / DSM 46488 / JCM 4925 / NBRC 14057 / NRRL 8057) TaxID=1003195 RepID=F8JLV5_STREN|nr:isocitrate lyase/PEP mutase family protein [Streptantibioticus cattleyicolor]AEW98237.1 carboxyvinyl-carboxyphosphonate phosphorylmutase [Streptantibioticus cattleyicolor NRRL 8057 = DSM 46488]CCB72699.1 Carboxyvinyl-carboxyphosphonate phosphorylmutase [Streptantibioticus cattleyicolor NRRL 8057 = DSM 46488]
MTTTNSPGARLRHLLAGPGLITAPGVYDGLGAHLVARCGFSAAYLTGAGVAAAGYGLPDIGLLTATEMVDRARVAAEALGDVPLIADADTGYGGPMHVVRTVRAYEQAGVAAVQLEDQAFPKKCGHLPGKELVSAREFEDKLRAALDARADENTVIVARTDARGPLGIHEAVDRANRYAAAGADVLFVEAPRDVDEIEQIAAQVEAPLLINMVYGGLTPDTAPGTLSALGYRIAIHPGALLVPGVLAGLDALRRLGGTPPADFTPGPRGLFDLVGLREWSAVAERYRAGTPDPA